MRRLVGAARRPSFGIAMIALLGLLLNLLYSVVVPAWMGPDEPRHVEYILLLVEKGRLVTWADPIPAVEQRIIRSMDQYHFWQFGMVSPDAFEPGTLPTRFDQVWSPGLSHELHQPPLYYLLLAPVAWLSRSLDVATQLALMRGVSALLATLTVFLTWLTVREAFPDDRNLVLASASFVAFLPMHAFLAGIVNNDVLAEVLGSVLIYLLVRGQRRGFSPGLLLASVMVVTGGLLTKRTTVFAVPLLALALVLPLRWKLHQLSWRVLVAIAALVGALLWAGARVLDVLVEQSARLPGPLQSLVYVYVLFLVRPSGEHTYRVRWQEFATAGAFAYYCRWLQTLFETFWARFGWANVRLDWRLYLVLAVLSLLAMAGACLVIWEAGRGRSPALRHQQDTILLLAAAVVFAVAVLIVKMVREWDSVPRATTQARFLFPALVPIAILLTAGLLRLLPERQHALLIRSGAAALLVFNGLCLLRYILPFYHLL